MDFTNSNVQLKKYTLTIKGRLPGLNEYSNAERAYKQKAARMKRETQELIQWAARLQLRGVRFIHPVHMSYRWIEKDRRRDKDNIAFAKKFVQDALVEIGVLKDDGWTGVEGFDDNFDVDHKAPRVVVTIWEVDGKY